MNEKIKLKINSYPKMIQEFAEANFNLKILLSGAFGLLFLCIILVVFLVRRGPTVIALDNSGALAQVETKVTDLQIRTALTEYIKHRYTWDDKSIQKEIETAQFFVLPSLVDSFERSMAETIKYVREKKVKQRVYPKSINVDLKEKKAVIFLDRITEFESLKAATEMRLELGFKIDDRTIINPWGVFITKESEGVPK